MLNKYECLDEIDSLQKHEPVYMADSLFSSLLRGLDRTRSWRRLASSPINQILRAWKRIVCLRPRSPWSNDDTTLTNIVLALSLKTKFLHLSIHVICMKVIAVMQP